MPTQPKKRENLLLNIALNIIIPSLIMVKGNKWLHLSPAVALSIALLLPLSYGIYDLAVRKKFNLISIIGFISILLTGGIGLLKFPKEWIALKEAFFPLVLGIIVLASLKTRNPLIKVLLFNNEIVDTTKVNEALETNNTLHAFKNLLAHTTYLISLSFLLSAILNFSLAKFIIQSETGTQAFTEELGKLTAWSYPIIAIPCMIVMGIALWRLINGIKKLTGLELEDVLHLQTNDKK